MDSARSYTKNYVDQFLLNEGWEQVDLFENWLHTIVLYRKDESADEFIALEQFHDFRENIWEFDLRLGCGWPELDSIEFSYSSVSTKELGITEPTKSDYISINIEKADLESIIKLSLNSSKEFISGKSQKALAIRTERNKSTMQNPLQTNLEKTKSSNNWAEGEFSEFLNEHRKHEERLRKILCKYTIQANKNH